MAIDGKLIKLTDLTPISKYFNGKIDTKVDKVEGKDLIDSTAITKLEGIEEGAQKNKINKIQVNGTDQNPTEEGVVNLDIEAVIAGDNLVGKTELEEKLNDYVKDTELESELQKVEDKIGTLGSVKGEATLEELGTLQPNPGDVYVVTDDNNHLHMYVGKNEYANIQKYGFVQTKAELDTAIEAGTSEKIDHDNNVFYVVMDSVPETPENLSVQFVVDDKTYAVNWDTTKGVLIGLGPNTDASHQTDIDFVKEADAWAAHDGSSVDVTGKTVKMSVVKYAQSAQVVDNLAGEFETILPPVTIDCNASVNKGPMPGVDENGFVDLGCDMDLTVYAKQTDVDNALAQKADQTALEQKADQSALEELQNSIAEGYIKTEDLQFATEEEIQAALKAGESEAA